MAHAETAAVNREAGVPLPVLSPTVQNNLALVARTPLADHFRLVGGTTVTMHLDHRRSYGLDFLTVQYQTTTEVPGT